MNGLTGKAEYYHSKKRNLFFLLFFILLTFIFFWYALSVGFYEISMSECYHVVIDHITGNITDPHSDDIIWGTRLPIALFAVLCGAILAVGGAVMQTVVRNPLADPYTMGISSGASLGATLAIIAGVTLWTGFSASESLVVMAFVFSLIPVAVIMIFSFNRNTTPSKMILIGIAVMYVFSATTSLLTLTSTEETHSELFHWNVGSLALVGWDSLPIPFVIGSLCIFYLMYRYRTLNTLMSGFDRARTLGVDSRKSSLLFMMVVSLMTASVVCFSGTIGFVGLVGPHIARVFVGSETKYLIPTSAALGAFFLLITNTIAMVAGDYGMPVGVISALVGCPLFIIILVKMKKRVWM